MGKIETLKSLEIVLESFLERAVNLKQDRLRILDGINRLDDLARGFQTAETDARTGLTDRIGDWFAEHRTWMQDPKLGPAERNRISHILGEIRNTLEAQGHATPATQKISSEIARWQKKPSEASPAALEPTGGQKIVLRRGAEATDQPAAVKPSEPGDSIAQFYEVLKNVTNKYRDSVRNAKHLMTVLDDNLESARLQLSRPSLMLSALIIYHLKQNGYLVEPFVKRLKEAEKLQKAEAERA